MLESYRIEKVVLESTKSRVSSRNQAVRFGVCVSSPIRVTSGVLQGYHVGPVLFNKFTIVITYSNFRYQVVRLGVCMASPIRVTSGVTY